MRRMIIAFLICLLAFPAVAQTTTLSGAGAPTGACATGSFYIQTDAIGDPTWPCRSSAWVAPLLSTQSSATGIGNGADATDDTLFTYTLYSNALMSNNKSLRVIANGRTANNGNNKTVKVWFNGTAIATRTNAGALTDWSVGMEVIRIDTTHVNAMAGINIAGLTLTHSPNLVVSDLSANTIIIKVTGASGSSAASDVIGYSFHVEFEP